MTCQTSHGWKTWDWKLLRVVLVKVMSWRPHVKVLNHPADRPMMSPGYPLRSRLYQHLPRQVRARVTMFPPGWNSLSIITCLSPTMTSRYQTRCVIYSVSSLLHKKRWADLIPTGLVGESGGMKAAITTRAVLDMCYARDFVQISNLRPKCMHGEKEPLRIGRMKKMKKNDVSWSWFIQYFDLIENYHYHW